MRKKKVLFVSEASWKTTGYSVYTKEVLSRLNQIDELEVAELSCYGSASDPEIKDIPWKVFPNKPDGNSEEFKIYKSNPSNTFGEWTFNNVCLKFQPDIVMDIRDWWMFEYQQRSPFRDFYHWAIMPTVDAAPQNSQWVNTFQSADAVFTYSEFGRDVLQGQCDNLNFCGIAPPAASKNFIPFLNKSQHKETMGLDPDSIIIGTVMRNQRRKLYPDLFKSFRMLLDETKNDKLFLHCHKYYPDIGWDTPSLLDEFGLNNRVLFSYQCKECKNLQVEFFQDSVTYCKKCNKLTQQLVGIENPIDEVNLNKIYNTFDIYVQYANSEGFGMPQLEAAYAGLPVISTYYSAMESVIDNIGGIGIKPLEYSREAETGCYRAIPDNRKFVDVLKKMIDSKQTLPKIGQKINKTARNHYSWDKTADIWAEHIKSVPMRDLKETWLSPANIKQPASSVPQNIVDLADKVDFIFTDILHKPEWIGGYLWTKVLKDCTFKYRVQSSNEDFYFNESHIQSYDQFLPFSFEKACEEMAAFRNQLNQWEMARVQAIGGSQ
tara:strand:+ start:29431 stop:31071 length:1641 start_codon:yes stop_codon:yes gene_type:complete